MRQASLSQNLVREDWDSSFLIPIEQPDPKAYARSIVIDGTKHIVSGATEIELEKAVGDLYREQLRPVAPIQQIEQPARDISTGRFTSQAEPSVSDEQKAELLLRLQLNQISMADYLEQSNAVGEYLEKAGVPIEYLRESVQDKQAERVIHSWESATQEFLAGSGSWWPGGEANLQKMGTVLIEMGAESSPSVENLRRAAEYLRDRNQLVETQEQKTHNREAELTQTISKVNDPYALRNMLQPSSGLFGR